MSSSDAAPRISDDGRGGARRPWRTAGKVAVAFAVAFTVIVALGALLEEVSAPNGSTTFDARITRWFVEHRTLAWTDVMSVVTRLGSSVVVVPLAAVVVVVLLLQRRGWLALFVALAVGGASLLSVLTKEVVGRERPPSDVRLQHAIAPAFPSGHTTQAAATYFALAIVVTVLTRSRPLRLVSWITAACVVLLVGVSRVYLGMHWATDVFGGWLLGSMWVAGLTFALAPLGTPRSPASSRAGHRAIPSGSWATGADLR